MRRTANGERSLNEKESYGGGVFVVLIAALAAIFGIAKPALASPEPRVTKEWYAILQVVVLNADGTLNWDASMSLPSKNFSGTTAAGIDAEPKSDWQWNSDENNWYRITNTQTTAVNTSARLKHPSNLWEYDESEYEFIGMGRNSMSGNSEYNIGEDYLLYDWKFENKSDPKTSFAISNNGQYMTYILKARTPEPVAPKAPSIDVVEDLLGDGAVCVDCVNGEIDPAHVDRDFAPIEGSLTVGDVTADGQGGYTVEVSVAPAKYVEQYSTDTGVAHTLDPATQGAATVTLSWDEADQAWEVSDPAAKPYATFTVICDTPEPEPETGSLSVTKEIVGEGADGAREFKITVTLSDKSINGTYGDMTFVDGVATLALSDGETATAAGLPVGVTFTVTEADYTADGYTASISPESGVIAADGTAAVTVTNAFVDPDPGEDPEPDPDPDPDPEPDPGEDPDPDPDPDPEPGDGGGSNQPGDDGSSNQPGDGDGSGQQGADGSVQNSRSIPATGDPVSLLGATVGTLGTAIVTLGTYGLRKRK